jgi:putative transposase
MKIRHTEEQILGILRQAEQGTPLADVLREHGISAPTYYRWKSKYSGLEPSQLTQLKNLERQNNELKKLVAEQALEIRMLKDINSKNW